MLRSLIHAYITTPFNQHILLDCVRSLTIHLFIQLPTFGATYPFHHHHLFTMSVPDIGWESLDIASDDEVPQIIQYADNGGTTVSPIERWSTFPWPKLEATREEVRERATVPSRSKMLLNKKVSFDSFAHTRKFVPVASSNYTIYDSGSDSGSGSGTEYIKVDES